MNSKIIYGVVAVAAVAVGFGLSHALMIYKERKEKEIAIVAVGFGLSHALMSDRQEPTAPKTEAPAETPAPTTLPEFSLKNRAGDLQSIRAWPDKSLIVNFWATWCAPCRREIPLLKELQKTQAAAGFQVVGIAVDFREDVLKYADSMQIDYPLLIGEQDGLAAVDAFGFKTVGFPFTVFTDKQGRIVTTHLGELKKNDAETILGAVRQVNSGELTVEGARAQLLRAFDPEAE